MNTSLLVLGSVVFLDLCLSGDNAVVIAMAANGLRTWQRDFAIYFGMALAAVLRIAAALLATTLLAHRWVAVAGGLALLWVAWGLFKDIAKLEADSGIVVKKTPRTLGAAIFTIIVADVSMSLDNVLAVAALAQGHPFIMAGGIAFSILCMALVAPLIAKLFEKRRWLNWLGLWLVVYVASSLLLKPLLGD